MAEGTTATTPAGSGGLTQEQLQAIVAGIGPVIAQAVSAAVKPIADNQKIIADTLAQQPGGDRAAKDQAAAGAANAAQPLTAEAVGKLVADAIANDRKAQQTTAQQQQARQQFIDTKLKNFPAAYADRLGSDPAKFEDEAKQIQTSFATDAQKFGWKVPDVGGEQPGGKSPAAAAPDLSKLSPQRLAELALEQNKANPPAQQTTATASA